MSVSYTYNDDGLRTGFALDPQLRCGVGRVCAAALRPGLRRRTLRYTVHGPGQMSHEIKETKYTYFGASAEPVSSTTFYYHFDALGNVLGLSNADGSLLETYRMDAFGVDQNGWTQDAYTTRRITGKEYDRDVGLYDFRARWYDTRIGRFLSRSRISPLREEAFAFCSNAPLNMVDWTGRESVSIIPTPAPLPTPIPATPMPPADQRRETIECCIKKCKGVRPRRAGCGTVAAAVCACLKACLPEGCKTRVWHAHPYPFLHHFQCQFNCSGGGAPFPIDGWETVDNKWYRWPAGWPECVDGSPWPPADE